jgi:hypothetical protein
MRYDDATATPPTNNEATKELTAPRSFRRLPATGRKSVAPPGTASATPLPWHRPDWSINLEGAWNAIVRSVPFRHARSSHAVGRGVCRRSALVGAKNRTAQAAPHGHLGPRHVAGGADRKPCGAAGGPVRCDDPEPDTRHDRHTPEGRQRRTRAHDPPRGRASPMPVRLNGRMPTPVVNRAGAPRRYVHRTGGAVIAARDVSLEVRIRSTGSGAAIPPEPRRAPGQPSRAGPTMRFARAIGGHSSGIRPDACLHAPSRHPGTSRASRAPPWRPLARPSRRRAFHSRTSPERLR